MSINNDSTPSTPLLAAVSHIAQNQTAFVKPSISHRLDVLRFVV